MNEKQLQAFLKTAELGSMTKAAAELFYSPQNTRFLIDALEKDVGCALFVRSKKGVALSPGGRALAAAAPGILAAMRAAREQARAAQATAAEVAGEVRVLVPYNQEFKQLNALLEEFEATYPLIRTVLVPRLFETTGEMCAAIGEGAVDLAMTSSIVGRRIEGLSFTRCAKMALSYVCFLACDHPLLAGRRRDVRADELLAQKMAYIGTDDSELTPFVTFWTSSPTKATPSGAAAWTGGCASAPTRSSSNTPTSRQSRSSESKAKSASSAARTQSRPSGCSSSSAREGRAWRAAAGQFLGLP